MNILQQAWKEACNAARGPEHQIITLRIAGIDHLFIGPVIHDPDNGIESGELQEVIIGDVVSRQAATQLIDGSHVPEWVRGE